MPIPRSKSFRRLVAKTSAVVEYKYNIPIICNEMSTGVVVYMVCKPITGPGIGIGRMGSKLLVLFICYSGLFSDFFIPCVLLIRPVCGLRSVKGRIWRGKLLWTQHS